MAGGRGGQLFIVSGPSGSGKSSVVDHLLRQVPDLVFSVSYTTRGPRPGEEEGREYRFISRSEFETLLARGEFLEHTQVFGNYYGTHRSALTHAERQGKDLLLDIEFEGTRQVKSRMPAAVAVLVVAPSWQELERRLQGRGLDTPEMMRRRLERAREEIENYQIYDYVVVNRVLGETCAQVEAIVLAERRRRAGRPLASADERQAEARAAAARTEANRSQVSAILETFGARTQ